MSVTEYEQFVKWFRSQQCEGAHCLFIPSFYITGLPELSIWIQLVCFLNLPLPFALFTRSSELCMFCSYKKNVVSVLAITQFCLKIYVLWRYPQLWVGVWLVEWMCGSMGGVRLSNKSWLNWDNSIVMYWTLMISLDRNWIQYMGVLLIGKGEK